MLFGSFCSCVYADVEGENLKADMDHLKKPTFAERDVKTDITREGFYKWEYVYTAEAVDVATGIMAKAKNYQSRDGAKEHARINLKDILQKKGIIS